jgi:prephenate dehydratase
MVTIQTTEILAFQGERGAFSEEAGRRLLPAVSGFLPCQRFEEVFQALGRGDATGAVVPIENTLHGSVHENYDLLLQYDFPIVAETSIRIVHNLIARPGVRFEDVRRAYSHPVALNQCLRFFGSHPEIEKVSFYDTAGSVKMVMEKGLQDSAAIASVVAADIYGAAILKESIEDDSQNFTRFFLLRPKEATQPAPPKSAEWKTSLVFSTRNVPGALFRCMSAFALRDLSLAKIESRPLRGKPWEYLFYLDFVGRAEDTVPQRALSHLGELADFLRILGSYPRGDQDLT